MSSLRFRNVDAEPTDPVDSWPYEALLAAVQRGALSDWRRIAAELARQPWGGTAAALDDYLRSAEQEEEEDGVTLLMRRALERARASARAQETARVASQVRELVAQSGLARAEFAARAGTSTSRLSTYCTGRVTPSAALLVRFASIAADAGPGAGADVPGPPQRPGRS